MKHFILLIALLCFCSCENEVAREARNLGARLDLRLNKQRMLFETYSYTGFAYKSNIDIGDTLYILDANDEMHHFIYVSNTIGEKAE